MLAWSHHRFRFPAPERYPLDKGARLAERLIAQGLCAPDELREAEPASWADLGRIHDRALLGRIRRGQLTLREQRGLGLPWSPDLVERARRVSAGTVAAAREALSTGVAINLGGGSHHAGGDFARGYCLFNDVVLAVSLLRRTGLVDRVLVVDCDVHQGDGTADLLAADPRAFCLSLHGARNYPFKRIASDLDVELARGTGDEDYLAALGDALATAEAWAGSGRVDLALYLAGADPWEGDRLGTLSLTKAGLRARDELVLDILGQAEIPVCVTLAGGYAPAVEDLVDINFATAAAVAARVRVS